MKSLLTLDVLLGERLVGRLIELPGDRNIFTFAEDYLADCNRPTLSLGFKGVEGGIAYRPRPHQTKVDPFFSNLLPEGRLRDYIAEKDDIHPDRDFPLLRALGEDLPGAVVVRPSLGHPGGLAGSSGSDHPKSADRSPDGPLKFSLAGVQMKLSAIMEAAGGLTVPASGAGGKWIIKFPSERFRAVPENEFWMSKLARRVGFDVPESRLVPLTEIDGLPSGLRSDLGRAFAVRRFDRTTAGARIHMEDFAQVFRVFPHRRNKYDKGNFDGIANVIWREVGEVGLHDYVARLVFTAAIGNGDMHLKNWSLLYPDGVRPKLAPVYDFLSTLTYAGDEDLGLNLAGTKRFEEVSEALFATLADRARLPGTLVRRAARETAEKIADLWPDFRREAELPREILRAIDRHLGTVPIMKQAGAARAVPKRPPAARRRRARTRA